MAVESHDKKLSELLTWVGQGKAQLPEFQRHYIRFSNGCRDVP